MNQNHIRNFCIIAHIDHGKSTLADRLLEMTHTISPSKMHAQFLDSMDLEREKGITIKLKAVRMKWQSRMQNVKCKSQNENAKIKNGFNNSDNKILNFYIFNLIDTPGHVDFSYEVSRSLAACEGALLLVDATQGIQAQTLANFYHALDQGLEIVPVINKIDMANANIEGVRQDLCENLGFREEEILLISAKEGTGVEKIFPRIIETIPAPQGEIDARFRALIFDSVYDQHKGVILYVRVVDGEINKHEKVKLMATRAESEILELGYLTPGYLETNSLHTGEIGFIATGLKDLSLCRVGDTVTKITNYKLQITKIEPLPGYKKVQPMVFLGLYPTDSGEFLKLKEALSKIQLTDASLEFTPESSPALGNGFRCGFLGLLHAEIIQERLEREYDLSLLSTVPNVEYEIQVKSQDSRLKIKTPSELPDPNVIIEIREPWVGLTLFSPKEYLGGIMQLCEEKRAIYVNTEYIGDRVKMFYEIPLSELIIDFYDQLKSISSGYASLDYEILDFRPVDAVKLDILIAGEKVEALSQMVVRQDAESKGRAVAKKLKEVIPRQQFQISLQAAVGGKIVAREDISAYRKDVTAKLYGGDVTRKMKLLEKQKKGKKRMKQIGRVNIPQEAFLAVLKK